MSDLSGDFNDDGNQFNKGVPESASYGEYHYTAETHSAPETTSYSETGREYEWNGNNRVFKGFRSEQSTKIKLKDISKLEEFTGKIFELQVYSIGSFKYSHSKQNEFDAEANLLALDDAKISAEKMAERMGVKICEVLYISDVDTAYSYSAYAYESDYAAVSQNKSLNSTSGFVVAPGILSSNREVVVTYRIK